MPTECTECLWNEPRRVEWLWVTQYDGILYMCTPCVNQWLDDSDRYVEEGEDDWLEPARLERIR